MYAQGLRLAREEPEGAKVATLNTRKIIKALTEVRASTQGRARLCLVGSGKGVGELARALSVGAARADGGISDALDVLAPSDFPRSARELERWPLVLFVEDEGAPPTQGLSEMVQSARDAGSGVLAVLVSESRTRAARWQRSSAFFTPEVAVWHVGEAVGRSELGGRIAKLAGDEALALAVTLPALRPAVVARIIATTARQNGVVGALVFIPGADMPVMTLNQVKMVLRIAAAYGEELGLERALEILSVVGAGFGLRTVAREALDLAPGPGWVLKGAFGYTATIALGRAAVKYFEEGAPLTPNRLGRLTETFERFRQRLNEQRQPSG